MDRKIDITGYPTQQLLNENGYLLELGCGQPHHRRIGYMLGLDIIDYGQEIVWDLAHGIPLPGDVCAKIYSSHCFEHVKPEAIVDVFNECWRVLRSGGELWVVVPHRNSPQAYVPTHLTYFDEKTFQVLAEGHGDCYTSIKPWKITEIVTNQRGDIHCKLTPVK